MHNRVLLTKESKRPWVMTNEMTTLVTHMITIITEAISFDGAAEQSPAYKYRTSVISQAIRLFDPVNSDKLAVLGAYFRHMSHPELVNIGPEEREQITSIIKQTIPDHPNPDTYIDTFIEESRTRLPRDSHVAFLTEMLMPNMKENFYENKPMNVRDKYKKPISDLIKTVLTMIEFSCTPLAVHTTEFLLMQGKLSELNQVWPQMQNNITTSINNLLDQKKSKKSVLLNDAVHGIDVVLQKFTGSHAAANLLLMTQGADYQALLTAFKQLAAYAVGCAENRTPSLDEIIAGVDYTQHFRAYGEAWQKQYDALHKQYHELKNTHTAAQELSATDKQQISQLTLRVNELTAEIEKLNAGLEPQQLAAVVAPPPAIIAPVAVANAQPQQVLAVEPVALAIPTLAPAEIAMTNQFIEDLTKRIKKIRSSWLGEPADREEKAVKLEQLLQELRISHDREPLAEVVTRFRAIEANEAILTKRRYTGLFDKEKPNKVIKSVELLDQHTRPAPQGLNRQ